MKKRLHLFLLAIFSMLGGINLQAEETILFDFSPSTTTGITSTFPTKATDVEFNGYTLQLFQTKWQKNKENSYIAFAKVSGASLTLPSFQDKIITKIAITCQSTTKSKFDLFEDNNTAALHQFSFTLLGDGGVQEFIIPEANQKAGVSYKFVTANTGNQCGLSKIWLYYREAGDPSKTDVELDWGVKDVNVFAFDENFTAPTLTVTPNEAVSAVTYKSSDPDVASIDADGKLQLLAYGETVITAEIKNDDTFNDVYASYTIHHSKNDPNLYFEREVRYGKLGVGVVWEAAKHLGDGTVTYSSSNPEIVAVNATTGQILPEDVKATGTVVITATVAATETYAEATADYSIVIQDPSAVEAAGGQYMFDFQKKDPYEGIVSTSDGSKYTRGEVTIPQEHISLVLNGKFRSWKANDGSYDLRLYKPDDETPATTTTFQILAPEAWSAIEKITINGSSLNNISIVEENTGSLSGTTSEQVWTAGEEVFEKVTFSISATTNIKSITVVWKAKNSNLEIANLSFDQTVYNTTVGVETEINTVNNPNNVATTYSIDCLNDDEYTLSEADGKLAVTVNKMGVYTLRAKSEATDNYLPGIAILRLNVFPVVDINVNEAPATPIENAIDINNGDKLSFGELPMTVDLYYAVDVPTPSTPETRSNAPAKDEFQYYNNDPIEFTEPSYIHYFMRYADAYDSPIYTLDVNVDGKTPTGIENVSADNTNAPVEYFNLQGIRVDNPAAGLYIRRQGNATTKVIVK